MRLIQLLGISSVLREALIESRGTKAEISPAYLPKGSIKQNKKRAVNLHLLIVSNMHRHIMDLRSLTPIFVSVSFCQLAGKRENSRINRVSIAIYICNEMKQIIE